MDNKVNDKMDKNKDKEQNDGQEQGFGRVEKENIVQVEIEGDDKISTLELMKNIQMLCGGLLACTFIAKKKEVTMSNQVAKRSLLDGFKIGTTKVLAKDVLVVSFLNLPA